VRSRSVGIRRREGRARRELCAAEVWRSDGGRVEHGVSCAQQKCGDQTEGEKTRGKMNDKESDCRKRMGESAVIDSV
jgi:hypothetical protein